MSPISGSERKLKRDYETFQSDEEKELAENVTFLHEELFPQVIKPNYDYSLYYWANITASCSGGPFLTGISRKFDSLPSPQFVAYFRNVIAPQHNLANLGIEDCLEKNLQYEVQCPCLQFLCSAIARHSSWVTVLSSGTDIMSSNHKSLYDEFIKDCTQNLRMIQEKGDTSRLTDLIDLEKRLTCVAFEAWPRLFSVAFELNNHLVGQMEDRFSRANKTFHNLPFSTSPELAIEKMKKEYDFLNNYIIEPILSHWYYLNAQVSTIGLLEHEQKIFDDLQDTVVTQWLEACIAANELLIEIVVQIDQLYSSGTFDSKKGIL